MKVLIADPTSQEAISYLKENSIIVSYQPEVSPSDLISQISDYEGLMVRSRTKVTKEVIEHSEKLKVVARIGSGYDNIDLHSCHEKNIAVVNAPDANSQAVAEMTIGLVIAFLRDFPKVIDSMKNGLWIKNEMWGSEISGKTVGIIGYGHVGKRVAKIMESFGANVLINSKSYQTSTLDEIFAKSDIVTLHLSLNAGTKGCITKELIAQMKQSAILVNLARAELVDEKALFEMLKTNKIRGAILDVYWQEPLTSDSKWRKLDNVILTPHIGAATHEALKRASFTVAEDIVSVLKGEKPQNPVI